MFINPIKDGYLTSKFGWRNVDRNDGKGLVRSNHQGVDLARQPNSNVDILAAADGEVIRVGALGTYGNIVIIKHMINGKRMDTNYAHLKNGSTLVKVGQKVKQGQKIATMGGTGGNFELHLHFEIHNGPWASGQPNAVDPAKDIKFYTKTEVLKMEKRITELENEVRVVNKKLSTLIGAVEKAAVYTSPEKPSVYAQGALKWISDVGVMKGDGKGNYNPLGVLTRQDAAVLFQNYHDKIKK